MTDSCLFCQIVAGDIPGRFVYEDEAALAFLDVNPLAPGHTLVVPKAHTERVNDLAPDEAANLFRAVATVVPAIEDGVGAPASTIAINNGKESGQEVPHLHLHVVPRKAGDGAGPIHALFRDVPNLDESDMDEIEESIAAGL